MSQSPISLAKAGQASSYDKAWSALNRLLRSGRSFSGHERNCCFLNIGQPRFADVSATVGLDQMDDGRALALTDWDYDGDLDLWITNHSAPRVRFLRNDVADGHHFLAV